MSKKRKLYYAETGLGATLVVSTTDNAAYHAALRRAGTDAGVQLIREATQEDIANIRSMGGYVPSVKSNAP
jgi:hypothetical protein